MKKYIYISLLTLLSIGCDDHLENLNTDKRNPAEVDPSSLFTQALKETFDMMTSININDGVFVLLSQYWTTTTYPEESRYSFAPREIPENFWEHGYLDALLDYKEAKELIREELATNDSIISGVSNETLQNRIAATNIMMAYVYSILVDTFGDIPYTEALDPSNLTPAYDDARTVYNSLLDSLDVATTAITVGSEGFPVVQDPLYEGNMENWLMFANTLKFRMGMRLADVDQAASVTIVNEALAAGVFDENADNASMTYFQNAPSTNPIYEDLFLSGRNDFVGANTIIDIMNSLSDPRREVYFSENLGNDVFRGGIYGDANLFSAFSHAGDIFYTTPSLPGTILNYAEVEFLMAEAIERGGYNVPGTAEEHYNAGIQASFDQWGVEGFDTYIAQAEVAYPTAIGDTYKEKIGIQLWLALYAQGHEGWTTWRRLDFGVLTPPEGLTLEDIPVRFFYPLEEAQLNGENYRAAGDAIGGDEMSTPIFWDVN